MDPSVFANRLNKPYHLIPFGLCLFLYLSACLMGCGVKKPPRPPIYIPPPQITDLQAALDQNQVKLAWTINRTSKGPLFDYESFVIYRAKIPVEEAKCNNCPYLFVKAAVLPAPLPEKRFDERLAGEYFESVASGFRYVYKVVGITTRGERTSDSNLVVVDNF
jgi:hypothetical protein